MKNAKKVLSLIVAVVLVFGLVACSAQSANDPELERVVAEQGDDFVKSFKEGFEGSSGGLKCDLTLKVKGTSLIFDCLIEGIDNVPEETKAQMQEIYDQSEEGLKSELSVIKEEAPNLSKILVNVCEEDGDKLAVIDIDF